MACAITILVPGLLGPFARDALPANDGPLTELLDGVSMLGAVHLLGRGDLLANAPHAAGGFELLLASIVGQWPGDTDPPLAAWSRVGAGKAADRAVWARADPVHLRADMSKLLLFDATQVGLSGEESNALAEHLESHMANDLPGVIEVITPEHWSMSLPMPVRLRTCPPAHAIGEDVARYLPTGDDAPAWRQLANLVQMVLHDAPVNRERIARAVPPINSLWFWGVGALPGEGSREHSSAGESPAVTDVWCRHAWARGAALWRGARGHDEALPSLSALLGQARGRHHLVVIESIQAALDAANPIAWREALQDLDTHWLQALVPAVRRAQVTALRIVAGHGVEWLITPAMMRRFWRRRRSAATLLSAARSVARMQ